MPRRNSGLARHHIYIYQSDWDFILTAYENRGVKPSEVIRELLHASVEKLKAKANAAARALPEITIDNIESAIRSVSTEPE